MKSTVNRVGIKKGLQLAKPFVSKSVTRPILTTALVTETHIIATDSHKLIRLAHGETVSEAYNHDYKDDKLERMAQHYPDTSRLLPDPAAAMTELTINVDEWLLAHELALIAAKQHKNRVATLRRGILNVEGVPGNLIEGFTHDFKQDSSVVLAYNCEYMVTILKTFKKLKEKNVQLYYYHPLRPVLFKTDQAEILVLPIKLSPNKK